MKYASQALRLLSLTTLTFSTATVLTGCGKSVSFFGPNFSQASQVSDGTNDGSGTVSDSPAGGPFGVDSPPSPTPNSTPSGSPTPNPSDTSSPIPTVTVTVTPDPSPVPTATVTVTPSPTPVP